MAIRRDRDLIEDLGNIPTEIISNCIEEHLSGVPRLTKLDNYYIGEHAILTRETNEEMQLPNNKVVANHAKYITDMATGYVFGKPIKYEGDSVEAITEAFKLIDIVSHDSELSKDLSVFGVGLELNFMSSDEVPIPKVTVIDPRHIFLVEDDTVEHKPLFAVHYYEKRDIKNEPIGFSVMVYTETNVTKYFIKEADSTDFELIESEPHFYNAVPVVEYSNNEEQQGDFEQQLSLIDAYNIIQSDRVNDKEQLVDAILMVKGISFGDDATEQAETARMLATHKILELPAADADAEWLTKTLNETQVEVLKDAIKSDIHEFSLIPNLTDENFASNSSGVAMKYKLFGLEQLAVIKERYYTQGLRKRLALFSNILNVKGQASDVSDIVIYMYRNLPEADVSIDEIVKLIDFVSNETLLGLLQFVDAPEEEIERVREQLKERSEREQKAFGMPFDDADVIEDDVKEAE
ncbi:phage portal protein [Sporosarcina limicola]|uniref:SPP1 family phage portal protein n=1 Tax=Sporosarcina limicola TaxID=34101 RepID=A0A927R4E3_9BACL|nr:phage portal protein [Sporosarcina limicola]MBE1554793.1 SPP1 family phage portal protein [Sporosarcina limicola]